MAESARVVRSLAAVLLLGACLRFVISAASGIAQWVQGVGYPSGSARVGAALVDIGSAGDGVGVLLALAALGLVWWLAVAGEPVDTMRSTLGIVLGLTAASAFVQALGGLLLWAFAPDSIVWSQLIVVCGHALVYAFLALGGLTAARHLAVLAPASVPDRVEDEPLVFAVDRSTGDVQAYLSLDEAARRSHVFSIEDNELAFYTDEGKVVRPSVEGDRVVLELTDVDQRDTLLERLGEFAVRRELPVNALDRDEPAAYAKPIREWQWLELWPGWLRWMGRLVRPR